MAKNIKDQKKKSKPAELPKPPEGSELAEKSKPAEKLKLAEGPAFGRLFTFRNIFITVLLAAGSYFFYVVIPAAWAEIANRPKVYISFYHRDTEPPEAKWMYGNMGHSDAVVKYFLAWVDGTPVNGWGEFKQRLGLRGLPLPSPPLPQRLETNYGYLESESRISAKAHNELFGVTAPPSAFPFLKANSGRVRFAVCYCSILGSWLLDIVGWDAGRCWVKMNRTDPETRCEFDPQRPAFGAKERGTAF